MSNKTPAAKPGRAAWRSPAAMQWARRLHLYIGALFAPAIIFFAATGVLQVYGLHEDHPGYSAPPLLEAAASLHKNQTLKRRHAEGPRAEAPAAKPAPHADADGDADGAPDADAAAPHRAGGHEHAKEAGPGVAVLKAFTAVMAVGLVVMALLGVYMAYAFGRNAKLVTGLLAAGVLVPLALILWA